MPYDQRENSPERDGSVEAPAEAHGDRSVAHVTSRPIETSRESAMADRRSHRDGKRGWGALIAALALLSLFGAWSFGLIDHLLYVREAQSAAEATLSAEDETEMPEAGDEHAPVRARDDHPSHYVYSQLIEDDQEKYRIILSALRQRTEMPYPSGDINDVEHIFKCVAADHPELLSASGISLHTEVNSTSGILQHASVSGDFTRSEAEEQDLMQQVDAIADQCLAGAPAEAVADDYALAKYLYEWMSAHVTYDSAADSIEENARDDTRTMVGALLNGRAVCSGYAGAYQYLMQKAGLQCTQVSGNAHGGSHAWCLALLDGSYYYIDPTWGDPQSLEGGAPGATDFGFTNYDYLCLTEGALARNHEPDDTFILPICTAVDDNYYVREELLFDAPDEDRFATLAADALDAGTAFQMQCADESTYIQLRDAFVASGALGKHLPGGAYRYSFSDEQLSISIFPSQSEPR